MNPREHSSGRARPPGAPPARPTRKKLPHDRPLWIRPEDEIFFVTVCCEPRRKNQLCYRKIADAIFNSVEFRNQTGIWYAHLVLLMPDHLHGLMSFPSDHRLRKEESFREKAEYIPANPVRAGLVTSAEKWRFGWVADPQKHVMSEGSALRRGAPGGRALPLLLIAAFALASCRPDMANQPRAKPLSESNFFADGTNARPLPPHTVVRGDARENETFYSGLTNGIHVTQLPVKVTPEFLERGRQQHEIFCAECHGQAGNGPGPVVQHGFPSPPPYQIDRLRTAPAGYLFDVIGNGHGTMAGYAAQIEPADRWAIVAYIRSLQENQSSPPSAP